MAKGRIMLQLEVVEHFIGVDDFPPLYAYVFDTLDGDTTVIREITTQKRGGMILVGRGTVNISEVPFGTVHMVFGDLNRPIQQLYAPSNVPSPKIEGAGMVILEVEDFGIENLGSQESSLARKVGAHVYLDNEESGPATNAGFHPSSDTAKK